MAINWRSLALVFWKPTKEKVRKYWSEKKNVFLFGTK